MSLLAKIKGFLQKRASQHRISAGRSLNDKVENHYESILLVACILLYALFVDTSILSSLF